MFVGVVDAGSDPLAVCRPYAVVRPYWKLQVVAAPFGLIVPVRVTANGPSAVAAPVITSAGGCPAVLTVRSAPTVVPSAFVATTR